MHISSLPSEFGIGTFGKSAYRFAELLKEAGQTWWQILPLCPTSVGDSPYQSFGSFAGNPYFIDFELLAEEGWIDNSDFSDVFFGSSPDKVDYEAVYLSRNRVFFRLYENFLKKPPADFASFCEKNAFWLDDYALFMAVKETCGGIPFNLWDEDIRKREPKAISMWRVKCSEKIRYHKMLQYFFFKQWKELKVYANAAGIKIIGDLPIYVSADSADVWSEPEQFGLKEDLTPKEVAGCPPDAFSENGQLWGNPVYNWSYMKKKGYYWWIKRLKHNLKLFDAVRIDHFRGFDSYYCIPADSKNAKSGVWRKGPGYAFIKAVKKAIPSADIIAEDLGFLTDSVKNLLQKSGFPGMKVLQFAFDSRERSNYLPHFYEHNSVVYTGTHDNDTLVGWIASMSPEDKKFCMDYLGTLNVSEIPERMIALAEGSVSDICILPMQDILRLPASARMNTPSTVGDNWKWRITEEQMTSGFQNNLGKITFIYGRENPISKVKNRGRGVDNSVETVNNCSGKGGQPYE